MRYLPTVTRVCWLTPALVGVAALAPVGAPQANTALIVVAHGADSAWNSRVEETVRQVHWPHGPVRVAYLMGPFAITMGWDTAVDVSVRAGAERVIAVPLLMSSYSGHYRQILRAGGQSDSVESGGHHARASVALVPMPIHVTSALDDAPELGEAFSRRWRELDERARRAPLVLVAHGPNSDREAVVWRSNLERVTAGLPAAARRRDVRIAQLRDDAPPDVRAAAVSAMRDTILALADRWGDSVTVLPALISAGQITSIKIPRDLDGLPIRYRPSVLAPAPELARWIERVATEALHGLEDGPRDASPAGGHF